MLYSIKNDWFNQGKPVGKKCFASEHFFIIISFFIYENNITLSTNILIEILTVYFKYQTSIVCIVNKGGGN